MPESRWNPGYDFGCHWLCQCFRRRQMVIRHWRSQWRPSPRLGFDEAFLCCLALAAVVLLAAQGPAADAPVASPAATPATSLAPATPAGPAAPAAAILHLQDGGFVPGELRDTDSPAVLRWQGSMFFAPFDFDLTAVSAIYFPPPAQPVKPTGDYCFELTAGDVLFGSLNSLSATEAELEVSRFGRLHVQRAALRRLYRWGASTEFVYLGPNGLSGWQPAPGKKPFREEAGHLISDQKWATGFNDVGLPARAAIELELSWTQAPDFSVALGVSKEPKSDGQAFRLEVWETDIVLQRETDQDADVASVQEVVRPSGNASAPGRLHVLIFLDQDQGRATVVAADGRLLAELTVTGTGSAASGIRLINKSGDVRLERLQIARWGGQMPSPVQADKPRLHKADGSIVYGQVQSWDAAARQFVVQVDGAERRFAKDEIQSLVLTPTGTGEAQSLRVVFPDGVRISGSQTKVAGGRVWLTRTGVQEPLVAGLNELHSLIVLHPKPGSLPAQGRVGRLELDGVQLHGRLVDGREQAGGSCLTWQPRGSATASPLRANPVGRIVYREPTPKPPAPRTTAARRVAAPARLADRVVQALSGAKPPAASGPKPQQYLHLRSGDFLLCEPVGIDEQQVELRTKFADAKTIPHDKMLALELAAPQRQLNKTKRERLLTLPRLQKDNPPTQLIEATNGDYLRGRITGLDAQRLAVEVRLETKQLLRDRVARIIWLHSEKSPASSAPPPGAVAVVPPAPTGTRVQALGTGLRLTYQADQLAGPTLSGSHPVLGVCRVELDQLDELLLGGTVDKRALPLAYQDWKLLPAVEPRVAPDDGSQSPDGRTPGTESPLVGQMAPEFELDLLGGTKFRLVETRGKIVVLDFWATWCNPCLQLMPQLHRVAREFRDQGVQLVAVNLQEPPEKITATLERLKLDTPVAMDRDGRVAEKYGAVAIPQVAVIDRNGKIYRLFIGSGPRFAEQFREALQSLLAPPAAAP